MPDDEDVGSIPPMSPNGSIPSVSDNGEVHTIGGIVPNGDLILVVGNQRFKVYSQSLRSALWALGDTIARALTNTGLSLSTRDPPVVDCLRCKDEEVEP